MATKPVEILIREGLKAEDFNDEVLGRTIGTFGLNFSPYPFSELPRTPG